jgi:dTDP-D-glucose 4,6-dehydratase
MKSAKFTEAQNKEEKADFIDSVGELVAFCEKEGGFIERYCTDQPKDIVDLTLNDMKKYTETLIKQDSGLAQQIEQYLKKKEIAEEMKQAEQEKENDEAYREDEDDDYVELFEAIERDREADELLYDEEDE